MRIKVTGDDGAAIGAIELPDDRSKAGLCTWKMAKLLNKYGYDGNNMGMKEARATIDLLAANNWKPIR